LFELGDGEEDIEIEINKTFEKYKLITKTKKGYDYDFTRE
jgi:hypothetical protein